MYRTSLRNLSPKDNASALNVHYDMAREKHDMNHTPHEPLNAPHAPTRLHEPSTSHGPEPCSAPSFPQERNTKPSHRSGDKQRQNIPQSLEPLSSEAIRASILRHSPTLNLTGLQIEPSVTVDTIRLILRQTSVLESLGVKLISDSSPPMGNLDMVTSSSLESFTIKTTIHPGQLLSNLILPKLAQFTLNARHADFSRENDVGLFKLLTNSNCSLVNLSLLDVYPRQSELINCLRHNACETLRSLTVRSTLSPLTKTSFRRRCLDDATLVLLALRTKSGPGICPHLEHLELSHCDPTSDEVFVRMAKTRVGPGPFRLEYSFLSQGQISDAVARRLAVLATTHPLIFRSTFAQVITADNL
ncbi:hypothetical protein H0H93_010878 [Arthromyces matolae]|nr:hypothetical protein H0H93_010878 [Arthromyces matolae]